MEYQAIEDFMMDQVKKNNRDPELGIAYATFTYQTCSQLGTEIWKPFVEKWRYVVCEWENTSLKAFLQNWRIGMLTKFSYLEIMDLVHKVDSSSFISLN